MLVRQGRRQLLLRSCGDYSVAHAHSSLGSRIFPWELQNYKGQYFLDRSGAALASNTVRSDSSQHDYQRCLQVLFASLLGLVIPTILTLNEYDTTPTSASSTSRNNNIDIAASAEKQQQKRSFSFWGQIPKTEKQEQDRTIHTVPNRRLPNKPYDVRARMYWICGVLVD
jgi:hypothetical protein